MACQNSAATDFSKVNNVNDPWVEMTQIVASIQAPKFQDRHFNINDFGADATGKISSTDAFINAIDKCSESGGGYVHVPKGIYKSGPIHLKSNVNLNLEEGAVIQFSTDPADYLPLVNTSFEGIELMNYSPLIYANNQSNFAITGSGILYGQASLDNWWTCKGSKDYVWTEGMPCQVDSLNLPALARMAEEGIDVKNRKFGPGHYLRPTFIEPFECQNVLIQGIKIVNAPFWIIHPYRSSDVIIDGVTVESHGPVSYTHLTLPTTLRV